jgi:capsular polysaccharide transport system permease protein
MLKQGTKPSVRREMNVLAALAVQRRVIGAMIIRDMMMRYGRANIGFLWVVLEPMILTVGVMFIWSISKSPYEHGVQVVALVMTGYMPLTLFRHLTNNSIFLYRRAIPFLYHRHISFVDVLVSKALLEFAGTTTALVVVYSVLVLTGLSAPVHDPALVIAGWLTMATLSFALGSVFSVMTEISEASERFVQPFQYLTLPLSGCFFMVDWIPTKAQDMLLYVPLVHCYELFRAGFFGESVVAHYTWWYPLLWALGLLTIGLGSIDYARDRIHTG